MIKRIFLFIIGILLCSYFFMCAVIYLNLLKIGYCFNDYLKYILKSNELLFLMIGMISLFFSLKKSINHDKK